MPIRCATCENCQPIQHTQGDAVIAAGLCRARPPTPVVTGQGVMFVQPRVKPLDDYCMSMWQPREGFDRNGDPVEDGPYYKPKIITEE